MTYPIIGLSIGLAFLLMIIYYKVQDMTNVMFDSDSILDKIMRALPSIIYSFVVIPLNMIYKYISISLNEWGNKSKYIFLTILMNNQLNCNSQKKIIEHSNLMRAI